MIKLKPSEFKFLIKLAEQGVEQLAFCVSSEIGNMPDDLGSAYPGLPGPKQLLVVSGELERLAKAQSMLEAIKLKSGKQSV